MAEFLFEIGLEEVPARMIAGAEAELLRRVVAMFANARLLPADRDTAIDAKSFSSPRRLAVWVKDVLAQQPDLTEEVTGPAVKIAFKEGVPTPAAEAFARKNGVTVAELKTIETPKGEYIAVSTTKRGRSAAEVIREELPKELAAIYWAKNMRWRQGSNEKFVRPVQWMVCLLGEDVVPVEFGGKTAERASYGHRVLSSGEAFEVQMPASYLAQLEGEYVLADAAARRHRIRKALDRVCRTVEGARWREDEALVDKMTHLTEWPDVLLGHFEPEFLELPEEVLVTVMRDHQNYFAVEKGEEADSSAALRNDKTNRLAPYFLAVTNIALSEANAAIIQQGNERVLRARFNDARFFWEFDQRTSLRDRMALLENVTFQKDLGSYAAKAARVEELAVKLARAAGVPVNTTALREAAQLAKADLTTELVKEFTELQGIIGGLYAKHQGVASVVADAIYDQYLPAGMDDGVPRSNEGALLGIADRADTIAGMFGLGMEPTGSKDPFALRRAANGIVKILAEKELPLGIDKIVSLSAKDAETAVKTLGFFRERVEFYLREVKGFAYDVVAAVVAAGWSDVRDAIARADAITDARGGEDFAAVSAAFKRMKNILAQAAERGDQPISAADSGLRISKAEADLLDASDELKKKVDSYVLTSNYHLALQAIATLRPAVDRFFEEVMVLDPDPQVRANRLFMLSIIVSNIRGIADLSEIVTAG